MSRHMRPLPTTEEWALELLAGNAAGVEAGKVSKAQLDGTKRRVLSWGVNPVKVEQVIASKKAPPRAGEL